MAMVWKLLVLVAVLMMPFGMAPATAARHHQPTASMLMQDCPEQGSKHEPKGGGFAACTMACAAALPAADSRADGSQLIVIASIVPAVLQALHGLHPDTATPPPKVS